MPIGPISGLFGTTPQNFKASGTVALQSIIGSLFSAKKTQTTADNIASLSIATQLQVQGGNFKQFTSNLASTSTKLQIADAGIKAIRDNLTQLKDIATQAKDSTLDAATRQTLSTQFKALSDDINLIVNITQFGGQKLLNGEITGTNAISLQKQFSTPGDNQSLQNETTLSISNLSTSGLFTSAPSLATPEAATNAEAAVASALNKVAATLASVDAFAQTVNDIVVQFEVAAANQQAAESSINLVEFFGSDQFSLLNLTSNVKEALSAQANPLNPALLLLIK